MAGRLRAACAVRLLPMVLLLLTLPAVVQAQFNYTTNNGTITITGYTGPGGAVTIPSTINGLPVTSIGDRCVLCLHQPDQRHDPRQRHQHRGRCVPCCTSLTSVTIGNSVTSIGDRRVRGCTSLTSVTIGNSVTSIGESAFLSAPA